MPTDMLQHIIDHKAAEVEDSKNRIPEHDLRLMAESSGHQRKSLLEALQAPDRSGIHIIAEIKRASPSKGILRKDLDPGRYASEYEKGGAAALSVLTDQRFFLGSRDDLISARRASSLPVLRKDFIISSYQIYESAVMGADAVLLIVRILDRQQLRDYLHLAHELRLDALVEVHSGADLETASFAGAELIGINNRDLKTFNTDIRTSTAMISRLQPGQIAVAASGIHSRQDLELIRQAGITNALVGESLVRAEDPRKFLEHLLSQPLQRV